MFDGQLEMLDALSTWKRFEPGLGSYEPDDAFGIVNPDQSFAQNWIIVIIPDCACPP